MVHRSSLAWHVAFGVAALGGCGESATEPAAVDRPAPIPSSLRVGTRVPANEPLAALPEPFNPARHRLLDNPRADRNLAQVPGFRGPPRRVGSPAPSPAAVPGISVGGDIGLTLWQWARPWYGLYAAADAGLGVQLPSRAPGELTSYLFAPTLLPPGWTCIEATTVHDRPGGSATSGHYQGWFDWCRSGPAGAWRVFEPMDQDFQNRYVRTYQGRPTIAIGIVTPSTGSTWAHCWFGTMYDYLQGGWVQLLQSCTTGAGYSPGALGGQGGWAYWESHNLLDGGCPSIADIAAFDLMFADPATNSWLPITAAPPGNVLVSGGGACWSNTGGPYTFTYPGTAAGFPANTWLARTTLTPPKRR